MASRSLFFRTRAVLKLTSFKYCTSSSSGHEAIKIRVGGDSTSPSSSSPQGKKLSKEELAERQKQLMGRNLPKRKPVEGVKKVVLVSSGKGGVGKSTVAVNLAVGMKQRYPEMEISLLDADVFGPSLPRMMNLEGEPELDKGGKMIPLQNYGVKCMSLGFLVSEGSPVVWRGLMVMSAIEKLVRGVNWSPSDILFVDMPPGTGDTQLTFAQSVQVDGAVIVTTPQQVALQDAIKGVQMFKKTSVPILGCVLNMSSYLCPSCHTETQILPENIQKLTTGQGTPLLGQLPLDINVSTSCDDGYPIVLQPKYSQQQQRFNEIVEKLHDKLFNDG